MNSTFKYYLVVLIASGVCLSSHAQKSIYAGINGTLAAPVVINQNNYGQRELPYEVFLSGNFGIQVGIEISRNSALQIELNYVQSGQSYAGSNSSGNLQKDLRLQYLQLPVWYKFNFKKDTAEIRKGSRWYGSAGVFAGYLLDADMSLSVNDAASDFYTFSTKDLENVNINQLNALLPAKGNPTYKELFNSLDFGVGLAIGVDVHLSALIKLNFELRGLLGIPDINAKEWRLPNRYNEYGASRSFNGGLNVGLNFLL